MMAAVLDPPAWIEVPAVVAGALAGALFAKRRGLDLIGILVLALVVGLGGGILRDVLLARIPLALRETWYLLTVVGAALVGGFFAQAASRMQTPMLMIDAISLGLFSVIGAQGALSAGVPWTSAILLGTITGVGGSVIADVLVGDVPPRLLRRGPPYGAVAILSASLYVGLVGGLGARKVVAQLAAVALACLIRGVAIWRKWEVPEPPDLTPAFLRAQERNRRRVGSDPAGTPAEGEGEASP